MKKLSFLLGFVLLLSLVSPAWASANVMNWDKYDYKYGKGLSDPLYTANDALLVEDMEDVGTLVYNYDLVRIDQNKKVEPKSFQNGLNRFVEHNGKSYSLFYNFVTDNLEVYDEYFNLVTTTPFTKPLEGRVAFYQYENYISYVMYEEHEDYWDVKIPQAITVIDLNTFEIVENVESPAFNVDYAYDDNKIVVFVYDQLGDLMNKFELSESSISGVLEIVNGMIYSIGGGSVIKLTLDGEIIHQEELNNLNYACYYSAVVVGDVIFYTCHDMDSMDRSTYTFSYNTKNDKLDQTLLPNVKIHPVDDNTYIEQTTRPRSSIGPATVKSIDGKTKATIQDEIFAQSKVSGKYILSQYPNKIIDIETGKLVGQIVENPDEHSQYVFIDNNKIYETTVTYDEDYNIKASSGTLHIINPDNSEKPKPDPNAHPADKKWTITFSMDVDADTVNASTVYVTDENGNKLLNQQVTTEGKKVIVHAPNDLYKSGKYVLHVENSVKSTAGEVLKSGETKAFSIQ